MSKFNENLNYESDSVLEPPDSIIGMKDLDKTKIFKIIEVPCLEVETNNLHKTLKIINKYLLKIRKLDSVYLSDNISNILINPNVFDKLKTDTEFTKLLDDNRIKKISTKKLDLNYDNFSFNCLMKKILKNENLSLSSFSIIGHIIHINLKPELEPYKNIIGKILLDKNPSQTIVLNKLDKINTVYRNFEFEILAKNDENVNTIVTTRENKIIFKFDFKHVYWNPRLSTEHERIKKIIPFNDIVFDIFAGIGPFAIPLAKIKHCTVFANDLNPKSFEYLKENVLLNKVENVECFNLDGRQFINQVIKTNLEKEWIKRYNKFELSGVNFHILMNLPASAIEFLTEFSNLFQTCDNELIQKMYIEDKLILPIVYCYIFLKEKSYEKFHFLIEKKLNYNIKDIDVFFVRNVAPFKNMFRLRFTLPKEVLFGEQSNKRLKTD